MRAHKQGHNGNHAACVLALSMSKLAEALKDRFEAIGEPKMEVIYEALEELNLQIRAEQLGVRGTYLEIVKLD